MMYKKFYFIFLILIISIVSPSYEVYGSEINKNIIILYESKDDNFTFLKSSLKHFKLNIDDSYFKDFDIAKITDYNYIFLLDTPSDYSKEIESKVTENISLILIGESISNSKTLQSKVFENSPISINYNEKTISTPSITPIKDIGLLNLDVLSSINTLSSNYPYIGSKDNLWYIGSSDFSSKYFAYITCDVLHNILKIDHKKDLKIYISLEDISSDINGFKDKLEYLESENIPVILTLKEYDIKSLGKITLSKPYITSLSYEDNSLNYIENLYNKNFLPGLLRLYTTSEDESIKNTSSVVYSHNSKINVPYSLDDFNHIEHFIPVLLEKPISNHEDVSYALCYLEVLSSLNHGEMAIPISSSLDKEILKRLINGISYFKINVGDIKSTSLNFNTSIYSLKTADSKLTYSLNPPKSSSLKDFFKNPWNILIVIIGVFCLVFLIIFMVNYKRSRKKLFKRKE
ncbi:hypothetical protein [Clostridium hydrogeniformans]|uniref:hypothetical protein n=1 Tax=Clostridium hydrogeniformans TaxID=349933 RepID=UPI0004846B76|nr:hypothetical protein [Clostridium hydrogeniformans]